MKRWKDYFLKTKLFIGFSLVSLVIVLLTSGLYYLRNVSDFKSQTFASGDTIVRQFTRTIDLYIQDIERLSISIFGDAQIQNNLIDHYQNDDEVVEHSIELAINRQLFQYLHSRSYLEAISVYTLDRRAYYMSRVNTPQTTLTLEGAEWYQNNVRWGQNNFFLAPTTEMESYRAGKDKVFAFVRNINRIPYREVIGYMEIMINASVFKNMIVDSDTGRAFRVLVTDADGMIVYDNRDELTGGADPELHTLLPLSKPASSGGELAWRGDKYLYTYAYSTYTDWNTLVLMPADWIAAEQFRSQLLLFPITLFAMLLIAVVSYWLSHQITLPLSNLMSQMSLVEQGDFSKRMRVVGNNELGRLSRIYNEMLDSIARLIREVYESRLAEKNAQLTALQSQINPHFLYNTLNTMKSISRIKGVEEVAEMAESLAELFHYSMKNLQKPIPLSYEVEHVRNYMNIQQHRFNERFVFDCQVPDHLMHAHVLKLTVQPLVENAISHGLGKVKVGGVISLQVQQIADRLIIQVHDNGAGIDPKRLEELKREQQTPLATDHVEDNRGIGLRNIHQRIQLRYGTTYGLSIQSQLKIGTTVTLEMPLETGGNNNESVSG